MRLAVIPILLTLCACSAEPDFDSRYDKAEKEIEARAKAMDADIAKAERLQDAPNPSKPPASSGE